MSVEEPGGSSKPAGSSAASNRGGPARKWKRSLCGVAAGLAGWVGLATAVSSFGSATPEDRAAQASAPAPPPASRSADSAASPRPRVIVLTDIGGDPDDEQSLVRLLLYSNELEIEGLIATGATYGGAPGCRPDLIEECVRAYAKVRTNLLFHQLGFPSAESLLARIKKGRPDIPGGDGDPADVDQHVGEGKDTEGSDWIISVADRPDPRPLWICIWGGPNELAQAVWKVQATRSAEQLAEFKSKLRVYAIGDQDDSGFWLERNHPDIFWLRCGLETFFEPRECQMQRGMYQLGDESLMSDAWMDEHVRKGHGPLGALYPARTWSPPNNAMKEGDTPSFLYLLATGLSDPAEPTWGSWGGRFVKKGPRYEDASDTLSGVTNDRASVARWRSHWQADFEARLDWCVKARAAANHEPCVRLAGPRRRTVKSGQVVELDASTSTDCDGNKLSYEWSVYSEAGSFSGDVAIEGARSAKARWIAPSVSARETIHFVLAVTDNGVPPLTRYGRVVVTVEPAGEDYFPPPESQGGWRSLSDSARIRAEAGMDAEKLANLSGWLLASDRRDFAALVIRKGYIVLEVERRHSAKDDVSDVKACAKAICATVLAIASERSLWGQTPKRMSFNDAAFQFIPWAHPLSDPRKERVKVVQLLNHTSGIAPETAQAKNGGPWDYILGHSGDPNTERLAFNPGTDEGYSTHAYYHAALVCEAVTGQPYDKFAKAALLEPLGIEKSWFETFEGSGSHGNHASHGVGLCARDLARIAYCMLRGGRWKSSQVVPEWFVKETAAPTHLVTGLKDHGRAAETWSHGWELPARLADGRGRSLPVDARSKSGAGGQLIAFVPSLDLVVVRQTGATGDWAFEDFLRLACAAVVTER
jgi:CubicO group peptidase (beta-lactamase class C family)